MISTVPCGMLNTWYTSFNYSVIVNQSSTW